MRFPMDTVPLTIEDEQLIKVAQDVGQTNRIQTDQISCTVGAALSTVECRIFQGVNIHSKTSGPTSICAETAAIAQMIAAGDRQVASIVAVRADLQVSEILPPCGACRHIISQFGNPWVIVSRSEKVRLGDLYPLPVR